MKEHVQSISFDMIAEIEKIKTKYRTALDLAKSNKFSQAKKEIEEAEELYKLVHKYHFEFAKLEAQGEDVPYSIIFIHAEDQLSSVELFKVLVEEVIELREIIFKSAK